MDTRTLFTMSAMIFACVFPAVAISGEREDVTLCAETYSRMTSKKLDQSGVTWTSAIFSNNRVVFPRSDVVCEVWTDRVDMLSEGNVLYISDGWPMDRKKIFDTIQEPLSQKRSQLRSEITSLDELQGAAEDLLRATGSTQGDIADLLRRVEAATGVTFAPGSTGTAANPQTPPAASGPQKTAVTAPQSAVLELWASLEAGRLDTALEAVRGIDASALADNEKSKLIAATERAVRPLPARDVQGNLAGYQILSILAPDNKRYAEKVGHYSDRLVVSDAPSISELSRELSEKRTRIQRDAFWGQVEGKMIEISGSVTEVKGGGILSVPHILIQTKIGRLSARCRLSDEAAAESALVAINIGDQVTCRGKASDYTLIFDMVEVVIDGAKI